MALLTYKAHGSWHHVLAWGGINARVPPAGDTPTRPQVKLQLDYSGGWGRFRKTRLADLQERVPALQRARSSPGS